MLNKSRITHNLSVGHRYKNTQKISLPNQNVKNRGKLRKNKKGQKTDKLE